MSRADRAAPGAWGVRLAVERVVVGFRPGADVSARPAPPVSPDPHWTGDADGTELGRSSGFRGGGRAGRPNDQDRGADRWITHVDPRIRDRRFLMNRPIGLRGLYRMCRRAR
jgi:hypothetical protein